MIVEVSDGLSQLCEFRNRKQETSNYSISKQDDCSYFPPGKSHDMDELKSTDGT
jgi:hypothetical protein